MLTKCSARPSPIHLYFSTAYCDVQPFVSSEEQIPKLGGRQTNRPIADLDSRRLAPLTISPPKLRNAALRSTEGGRISSATARARNDATKVRALVGALCSNKTLGRTDESEKGKVPLGFELVRQMGLCSAAQNLCLFKCFRQQKLSPLLSPPIIRGVPTNQLQANERYRNSIP